MLTQWLTNLVAAITLVRLLSTVHPLVSVQVVTLNEPHVTRVASEWLFSCERAQVEPVINIYQDSQHISLDVIHFL